MILEFSITNFYSYRDKVTFSMHASNSGGLEDNYVTIGDKNILKSAVIYGANASGKSNIFKTLTNIILMIRNSNRLSINAELPIIPFKFDEKSKKNPSEFEIKFISKGIRYVYGFCADKKKVYEEYLYYYPNGRESLIFDRRKESKDYPRDDKRILEDIDKKTSDNRFFLPSAAYWNHKKCEDAFYFFDKTINTFLDVFDLKELAIKNYLCYSRQGKELENFALKRLFEADMNIEKYFVFEAEIPKDLYMSLPDYIKNNIEDNAKGYGASFKHKNTNMFLDFNEESKGTQMLFIFLPFIYEAINDGAVIIIDELDRSLHPMLVEMIVNLFSNKKINKGNAQLIFNTHDTNLLKETLFRKDQIWFTEKDNDTGVSKLYSLSDIKIRPGENYERCYLSGKYGALPNIDNPIRLDYKIGE